MFQKIIIIFLASNFLLYNVVKSQDIIRLKNGSFEDTPKSGDIIFWTGIKGWVDCGPLHNFTGESPPDVHPNGIWGNHLQPFDGKTYLGMVARDNGTYESVCAQFSKPLEKGKCYSFSLYLARSETYNSHSRLTGEAMNYNLPLSLKVFGGKTVCKMDKLIAETKEIENTEWVAHNFDFQTDENLLYINIVAYYKKGFEIPYCGNLLIDGISDIISKDCE